MIEQPQQPMDVVPRGQLPEGEALQRNVAARRRVAAVWRQLFLFCTVIGLVALALLLYNVVDRSFGVAAIQAAVNVAELTGGRELDALSKDELVTLLTENLRRARLRAIERQQPLAEREQADLLTIFNAEIAQQRVVRSWPLHDVVLNRASIDTAMREEYPDAQLVNKAWLTWNFVIRPIASDPVVTGISTAIVGSLVLALVTMVIAIPLGVATALYLEEYAPAVTSATASGRRARWNTFVRRMGSIIQVNISNLAGVPSIIYGILGLSIFVRALAPLTSGAAFGYTGADPNIGRSILSAGATMALLILPLIIVASQEAIRAVPNSIRQASYGLGATKWQTIRSHVLPIAFPGILTGVILSLSRAIGETAPLIVVGAATFVTVAPDSIFARYTTLPIQIYNWTAQPQVEYRNVAAAGIIVLLVMLLSLNALAIYLRNRLSRRSA